jgi:hypothetical protein
MQVKVLPTRLRCDSLPAHTDQTRFLESEAGNRAQSDIRCGMTLALMGSSYGETEPKKATYSKAGRNNKTPTSLETIPAAHLGNSGKSLGNPVVEVAPPNGTNNLTEGTNKNELRV